MTTLTLTRREVPDGSLIAVLSDVHIPYHDDAALQLVLECCEREGVSHVFLNGDIADCGPASRHEGKRKRAVLDEGSLRESIEPGMWLFHWALSKKAFYTRGNHEGWIDQVVEQSPELKGTDVMDLMGLPRDRCGWRVLPPMGRIRLGSRCWEHGDGLFKSGSGGQNPGNRVKSLAPDQTTSIGHLHRRFATFWTTYDEDGAPRTRGAYGNGHLSLTESHADYAGSYLNWQKSFELTRVFYVDDRPRFTTYQPEIYVDRRGRPYFEHNGHLYI